MDKAKSGSSVKSDTKVSKPANRSTNALSDQESLQQNWGAVWIRLINLNWEVILRNINSKFLIGII